MLEAAQASGSPRRTRTSSTSEGEPPTDEMQLDRTQSEEPDTTCPLERAARAQPAAVLRSRGLQRAPQARAAAREAARRSAPTTRRLGPGRGARVRVAAGAGRAAAAHRTGHRARHLQPAPPGAASTRRPASAYAPIQHLEEREGAVRDPQQPAVGGGGARLRVRLRRAGARDARDVGGAVRRLRQRRAGDRSTSSSCPASRSGARRRGSRCCCRTATRAPGPSTRARARSAS